MKAGVGGRRWKGGEGRGGKSGKRKGEGGIYIIIITKKKEKKKKKLDNKKNFESNYVKKFLKKILYVHMSVL